nr:MAG: hypothetical protein [Helarchaeota virus Nidhogg Meg22_1012]
MKHISKYIQKALDMGAIVSLQDCVALCPYEDNKGHCKSKVCDKYGHEYCVAVIECNYCMTNWSKCKNIYHRGDQHYCMAGIRLVG